MTRPSHQQFSSAVHAYCVVSDNIYTSPKDVCLVWTTPPHPTPPHRLEFQICFILPVKSLAFETPLPFGISNDHPWNGYEHFLEPHIQSPSYQKIKSELKEVHAEISDSVNCSKNVEKITTKYI